MWRCRQCGRSKVRSEEHAAEPCSQCGSENFDPVPIIGEEVEDLDAAPGRGPTIDDTRFGRMAFFSGWMSQNQVDECLARQREAAEKQETVPAFGEVAMGLGFLDEPQVSALLRVQHMHRPLDQEAAFGILAVRRGIITQQQLDDCLAEQRRLLWQGEDPPALGVLLSERGLLSTQQVRAIIEEQAGRGQGLLTELDAEKAAIEADTAESRRVWFWVMVAALAALAVLVGVLAVM